MELVLASALLTFAATVAGGLFLKYHETLGRRALNVVVATLRLARWPVATLWKRCQRAIMAPVSYRLDDAEQRLDSQESILRSRQMARGTHGPEDESRKRRDNTVGARETEAASESEE